MAVPVDPGPKIMVKHIELAFFLFCALTALFGAHGIFNAYSRLAWGFALFVNLSILLLLRRVLPLVVLLLFNLIFIVYSIPHIFYDINLVSMPLSYGRLFLAQLLWQISLMLLIVILWWVAYDPGQAAMGSFREIFDRMNRQRVPVIFYGLMAVTLVSIFWIRGSIIYGVDDPYTRYVENLSEGSGLPEYLLIPFFLSALFCRTRFQKYVWYLVWFLFSLKLFLLGLRISMLMGLLLAIWFSGIRLSFAKVSLTFILGFLAFSVIGLLKVTEDPQYIVSSVLYEMHGDYVVSHHGNVLWSSSVMLSLIKEGFIDVQSRMDLLFYFILNTLTPSSWVTALQEGKNFGSWLQASGFTSGGGHAATYAFLAMGSPGIVLVSSLLGAAGILSLSKKEGVLVNAVRCWFLMTLITFPRWISYDIGNFFFRLPLYAAIGYLSIILIIRTVERRRISAQA